MGLGSVPKVATITVGTNERAWLSRCLESLVASDATGLDLTVYYVDNASVDGSADMVRSQFPAVTVLENGRNLGFAAANNVGMRRALVEDADYIFLVNPDTFS